MKLALIAFDPIVGDFGGNLEKAFTKIKALVVEKPDLVVFPELSLVGYPPLDLVYSGDFMQRAEKQLDEFVAATKAWPKVGFVVGTVLPNPTDGPRPAINAGVFVVNGRREIRAKTLIPTYDIFDEGRYFTSSIDLDSSFHAALEFKDKKIGLLICEDNWSDFQFQGRRQHSVDPVKNFGECDFLVNISASPYATDKKARRRQVICASAKRVGKPLFYVNTAGANDEIIFDGDAFAVDENGEVMAENRTFQPGSVFWVDAEAGTTANRFHVAAVDRSGSIDLNELRHAIVLGIRDYAAKNKFQKICLGLSGGIDSALVAVLAAEAVGPKNVYGYSLPSKYSTSHSREDAEELARNLGLNYETIPIKFLQSTVLMALQPYFQGKPEDKTEENLQARLRGLVLMAMANKLGYLLLSTGNKSELAVGYATLYGDMCGGLLPLGDIYKTQVYELAKFLNSERSVIPEYTFVKPPSAELKPDQRDQDTLPPYDVLDLFLHCRIEQNLDFETSWAEVKKCFPKAVRADMKEVEDKYRGSEFKRKQVPLILRVSTRAFGLGRRHPLTAR